MNFTCDNCQRRYTIADEKVIGKTVKVRCRNCSHLVSVTGPAVPEERTTMMSIEQVEKLRHEQRAAARTAPGRAEWLVMVKGKQTGPLDLRGLAELCRVGEITQRSFAWRKGMPEWKRMGELPDLASLFAPEPAPEAPAAPPPPPPPPAAPAPPRVAAAPVPRVAEPLPFEEPKSEPERSAPSTLDELFSDADLPEEPAAPEQAPAQAEDPFASLGDIDPDNLPPPGEATRFFIAQAGVDKRNPPWKIAAFILGGVGAVAGLLFALGSLNIVPLTVKRVDASGQEVEQSVFSGEGISALGDLLLGKDKPPPKAARPRGPGSKDPVARKGPNPNMPEVEVPLKVEPTAEELALLYGDTSKKDRGPRVRKNVETRAKDTSSGGLTNEQVAKVVAKSQSAFQGCIEQELRKNPNLKIPRFYIRATVATSGVVKSTSIDRREIDASTLGECLKRRAKRMVFAQFSGEELQVEIPLIVGVSM